MRTGKDFILPHILYYSMVMGGFFMKQKTLKIHCIFPTEGESVGRLVLQSFSLYLRRVLAEDETIGV